MPHNAAADDSARQASLANFLRLLRTPMTASSETDRERQQRLEAIAAHAIGGAGQPSRMAGGTSIAVPLPFGGPSRKQRERDRAINAQTMEILARTWKRADSVRVARERRRADSLAQLRDTMQREPHL